MNRRKLQTPQFRSLTGGFLVPEVGGQWGKGASGQEDEKAGDEGSRGHRLTGFVITIWYIGRLLDRFGE